MPPVLLFWSKPLFGCPNDTQPVSLLFACTEFPPTLKPLPLPVKPP